MPTAAAAVALLGRRAVGPRERSFGAALRDLDRAAVILSFSVFADSLLEHYRGSFHNRMMYVGPSVAGLTLAGASAALLRPRRGPASTLLFASAVLTGAAGSAFHAYNLSKREGGVSWSNLFYAAPLGAPLVLSFAGLFALAATRLAEEPPARLRPGRTRRHSFAGAALGTAAALGIAGSAAEAGLMHFRGAFQDPFMFVPVTVPPVAAAALCAALLRPASTLGAVVARVLLRGTAVLGVVGLGLHARGVQRGMGGWRNWRQTLLQGPPLPAPPAFTGMAFAGLAALSLRGVSHGG